MSHEDVLFDDYFANHLCIFSVKVSIDASATYFNHCIVYHQLAQFRCEIEQDKQSKNIVLHIFIFNINFLNDEKLKNQNKIILIIFLFSDCTSF